ncbi:MAG: aldehyde dehydrogenase, partial [Elusimicrobia bacterium]
GSVWTRDIGRALRVSKAIKSGVISVNSSTSVHLEAPFGGYKRSGLGRELGMNAMQLYSEVKNIFISEE